MQEPRDFSFSQYKQRKSSHYHYIPPQSAVQTRARLDFFWNFFNACFDLFDCGVVLYRWCLDSFCFVIVPFSLNLSYFRYCSVQYWILQHPLWYCSTQILIEWELNLVRSVTKKVKIKQNRTIQMNLKQDNPFIGKFNKNIS